MRCASPPDSVALLRSSVRYDSPTSVRNWRRLRTSFRISLAMTCSSLFSGRSRKKSRADSMVIDVTSWMFFPLTRTDSASGLSRFPAQERHGVSVM
jgi:hypothetical protein